MQHITYTQKDKKYFFYGLNELMAFKNKLNIYNITFDQLICLPTNILKALIQADEHQLAIYEYIDWFKQKCKVRSLNQFIVSERQVIEKIQIEKFNHSQCFSNNYIKYFIFGPSAHNNKITLQNCVIENMAVGCRNNKVYTDQKSKVINMIQKVSGNFGIQIYCTPLNRIIFSEQSQQWKKQHQWIKRFIYINFMSSISEFIFQFLYLKDIQLEFKILLRLKQLIINYVVTVYYNKEENNLRLCSDIKYQQQIYEFSLYKLTQNLDFSTSYSLCLYLFIFLKLKLFFYNLLKYQAFQVSSSINNKKIYSETIIIKITRKNYRQLMIETFLHQPTHTFLTSTNYCPNFDDLTFNPSFYTQQKQGQTFRKFDMNIRNSTQVFLQNQHLTTTANDLLRPLIENIGEQLIETNLQWRMIKYDNGHFIQHCDHQRRLEPYVHFGTQILLPPRSLTNFQGGVLKTKDVEEKEILPDQLMWTLIVMPLGVLHEITEVKGMRVSFVKPIYIRKLKENYYTMPKTSKYGQDNGPNPNPPLD